MARPVRILSIDGGGIRGIIPALLLAVLEEQSGRHTTQLFDLIVGTSTGGILGMALTVPGASGRPAFAAADLLRFYTVDAKQIFSTGGRPTWQERLLGRGETFGDRMTNAAQYAGSPFGGNPRFAGNARHFPKGLEQVLNQAFGTTMLSQALVEVAVTTYDAKSATAVVLSRTDARQNPAADISMADAARATSAAPTFFPPAEFVWNGRTRAFVDGGVWANNPSLVALSESLPMTAQAALTGTSVVLVSLGTGQLPPQAQFDPHRPWLSTVKDLVALGTGTDDAHRVVERALGASGSGRYWRFQVESAEVGGAMDDPTAARVQTLKAAADTLIAANRLLLETVITALG